jgi:superfamily II DNA or RNA helicase
MLQTISRKEEIKEFLSGDGQIIIDECHHIPAVSFESALKEIPARYVVGLTATPYRKGGLQAILYMQCGPVRYEIKEMADLNLKKRVIVRDTSFSIQNDSNTIPIYEIWESLVNDNDRLQLVANDIIDVIKNKRFPLILSDRKDHLYKLKEMIEAVSDIHDMKCFLFEGDIVKKARLSALLEINEMIIRNEKPYILSTGSLIGEGFICRSLIPFF